MRFRNDPDDSNSLSDNQVYAMYEDKDGIIWIGTEEVENWSEARVAECIFEQGISTASEVNLISGRGVGMDIIKQRIKSHRGQIRVTFSKGEYCEFIIILPLNDKKENNESTNYTN